MSCVKDMLRLVPPSVAMPVLAIALVCPAAAQSPRPSAVEDASRPPRAVNHSIAVDSAVKRLQGFKPNNSSKTRQDEFSSRIRVFAQSWNRLMRGAEKGVWKIEDAIKARKAFERLVRSEGWVETDRQAPSER